MKMIIAKNHDEASSYVANRVADTVRKHENACLGLATGGSMEGIYAHLVKLFLAGDVHFKSVKTANLDEYVGLWEYLDENLWLRIHEDATWEFVNDQDEVIESGTLWADETGALVLSGRREDC